MNTKVLLLTAVLAVSISHAEDVSCADNATCIQRIADQLVKGVRENRSVNVLNLVTIEPMPPAVQGRANAGILSHFFNTHAVRADFGRYSLRLARSAQEGASVDVDLEYNDEGRALKAEGKGRHRRRRRILQVILPMVLGFKAASTIIMAISAVAMLTFKAFLASKLALLVTGSMIVKKFFDGYGGGLGGSHQPYVFSQYPIDFSSPGAHPAYTMTQTAYANPELYGISGQHNPDLQPLNAEPSHELSGQYSQGVVEIANPNITSVFGQKAGKRWDQDAASYRRRPIYYEDNRDSYQEYH